MSVQSVKPVSYQWQRDGQDIAGATYATLFLSGAQAEAMGTYSVRASNEYGALQSTTAQLQLGPSFVERPQNQILRTGENLELCARMAGSAPMTYLWRWEGVSQSRLTLQNLSSSFSLPNVQLTNAGKYVLSVTNMVGSASPGPVTTSVIIVEPPVDQAGAPGSTVAFTADIRNGSVAAPGLQWQFGGKDIAGATEATLTLNNVQAGDVGTYTLVVTNNIDRSASFSAALRLPGY